MRTDERFNRVAKKSRMSSNCVGNVYRFDRRQPRELERIPFADEGDLAPRLDGKWVVIGMVVGLVSWVAALLVLGAWDYFFR